MKTRAASVTAALVLLVAACSTGSPAVSTPVTSTAPITAPATSRVTPTTASTSAAPSSPAAASSSVTPARPVIVIDPGHSPSIHAIDPHTGLDVSDYENEPEMRDVFTVATLVADKLRAAGYRVVLTKKHVRQRVTLAQRAAVANRVHAALALSIHDQAGADGGIEFDRGNNIVYYQSLGTYRETASGKKIYFRNKRIAALSKKYAKVFRREREAIEHHAVRLQGNTGYDLGSRGLAPGDIWTVQLLSHVPWIYNEAGGNSAGRVGLERADERRYADALVASVERCVPLPH